MNEDALVQEFLQRMPRTSPISEKVFISFVGLPGSGKSRLASDLSDALGNIYIRSNDEIRRFLNDRGIEGVSPDQQLLQRIAQAASAQLLSNGVSHILDADILQFIDYAKRETEELGFTFLLIYVVADEDTILERLRQRGSNESASRAGVGEYEQRKAAHTDHPLDQDEIFFGINTSSDYEQQFLQLVDSINEAAFSNHRNDRTSTY